MSFEKGGRSDKQGNVYENRCLARILQQTLQLLRALSQPPLVLACLWHPIMLERWFLTLKCEE